MSEKATIVRDEQRRESSEIRDDDGTPKVVPPQLYVRADEGKFMDVIEAVAAAIAAEPNAVDGPAILARDDDEFGDLTLVFRPNELPVVGDDGVEGWLPPYRAEEDINAALREELPSGWTFEIEHRGRLVLFEESA